MVSIEVHAGSRSKSAVNMSASLVDSEAFFKSKCSECGLPAGLINSLVTGGINTLAKLAFAVGQPGQAIQGQEVDDFLTQMTGTAPALAEAAVAKRLIFEAHTVIIATLKQSVEQRDETTPKKVPAAERNTRIELLKRNVRGVELSGEFDPSHALLDKASDIFDKNVLRYLDPAHCTSRSAEVQGINRTKELALEGGALVVRDKENKLLAPTATEMQLFYAFSRRGLAMQFAELMSYVDHQRWVTFLFQALHREVPPGYCKPSLHQIMLCDRAAWTKISEVCTEVRRAPDGTYPLVEFFNMVMRDPTVTLHLSPLAKPSPPVLTGGAKRTYDDAFQVQDHQPKGKGKKGKGKGKAPAMPKELIGKYHRNAAGDPICFAFNTQAGCSDRSVQPGGRCSKGLHICAEPKCQEAHSLQQHKK